MAFNPASTVYLCNVPIDNTYQNQIYFANAHDQYNYFLTKVVAGMVFTNYLTVRKVLPDGTVQSSIRVDKNIDDLYKCNYMFYQNKNHGEKWFYAFITKFIYVNENCTEIIFETDVYQTWLGEATLLQSFVVREHSKTDTIGDNLIPENFNIQDYVYSTHKANAFDLVGKYGILIASSAERENGTTSAISRGRMHSGIYQGLYFYFFQDDSEDGLSAGTTALVNSCLDDIEANKGDSVQFIAIIPRFCLGLAHVNSDGYVSPTFDPAEKTISFTVEEYDYTFGGYEPKNKKMFTAPFFSIMATDHNGTQAIYNFEDFADPSSIKFKMYGDISANPSITMIPQNYKHSGENNDFGISLSGFPQCSFNSDTFKLWLAKNEYSLKAGIGSDVTNLLAGTAMLVASGGTALATGGMSSIISGAIAGSGASKIASGANGIFSTIGNVYSQSKEPNAIHAGSTKNNLLTAIGQNTLSLYIRKIKEHQAKIIDDYFTMFGYQTNTVKVPNVSSRPYFNYVQTQGANIVGAIPNDDMRTLKAMYDNGVTFWKPHATVGKYDVDNRP